MTKLKDIKKEIGANADLLEIMLDGTLTHKEKVLIDFRNEIIESTHAIKGFYDTRKSGLITGGESSERIAMLIAEGMTITPTIGDSLVIDGERSIIDGAVEIDPAGATYTFKVIAA